MLVHDEAAYMGILLHESDGLLLQFTLVSLTSKVSARRSAAAKASGNSFYTTWMSLNDFINRYLIYKYERLQPYRAS